MKILLGSLCVILCSSIILHSYAFAQIFAINNGDNSTENITYRESHTGASIETFELKLGEQPTDDVRVTISGHVGEDIVFPDDSNTSLTFTNSNWNTGQIVTFSILADVDTENDQITLQITASGGGYSSIVKELNVVIIDEFSTPNIYHEIPVFEEGIAIAHRVHLTIPPTEKVTLNLSVNDRGVYVNTNDLTFTPQDWWRDKFFVVFPHFDDNSISEKITLTYTASGGNYDGFTRSHATYVVDRDVITNYPKKINSSAAFSVTFTFVEPVRDFDSGDVTVTGGTKGALSGTGQSYSMEIRPTGGSDVVISVAKHAVTINGILAFPATPVIATILWDITAPTLSISGVPDKINSTLPFKASFTFNESVTGFDANDVTVTGATSGTFKGSGASYSLPINPTGDTNVIVSVDADVVTDEANNTGPSAQQSQTAVWDGDVPTLSISRVPDKINDRTEFTAILSFSKSVTGFDASDVTVTGATSGTFTGSGTTYSLPVTPLGNENVVISVAANSATDGLYTVPNTQQTETAAWDATAPELTISDVPEKINTLTPFTVEFTFSESVTEFDVSDVAVTGGAKGVLIGSGTTYSLPITPSGGSDVVVTVGANVATDGLNTGPSTQQSETVVWDVTVPTLSISGVPEKINNRTPFTVEFTFSESVTEFDVSDVAVTGGAKGVLTGSGTTYTMAITPSGNANVVVSVATDVATDGLNTGPSRQQSETAVWDNIAPELTISDIPEKINNRTPFTVEFIFSESVTEFDASDVAVTGGAKGVLTGSGTTYTMAITPSGNANVVVSVATDVATDGLNTGPSRQKSETAVWDNTSPVLTISGVPSAINSETSFTAFFRFTEDVTGFEKNDVTVTGGIAGGFEGSGTTYSLIVTPSGGSDVVVTVDANAATDGLNTAPATAQSSTAVWSTTALTMRIMDVPTKINDKDPFTIMFTFSASVTGFETNDITVTGGAKGVLTGGGTTYTMAITPSGSANVVVSVAADVATDGLNTGPNTQQSETAIWDITPPGLTISDVPEKINNRTPFTVEFTFSESVTEFDASDVAVTGGAKGVLTGSGTTYTMAITPSGNANVVVSVAADVATDGLNTGPSTQQSETAIWDITPPGLTISGIPEKINNRTPFSTTFTFDEPVTGFDASDVAVTGGAKGVLTGSGTTYTMAITPSGNANVVVSVATNVVTDGINTAPSTSQEVTAIWDATPPTLEISSVPAKINSSTPLTVTFTFDEVVTGFDTNDISVSGGTKGAFTGNGSNYSLVVTPTVRSDVVVTVATNATFDGLNYGPASETSRTATWDDSVPTLTITGVPSMIIMTTPFTATFTFSEDVLGFETGDISVTGGTKGELIGSGQSYTLIITPNGSTNVVVSVAANTITDGINRGPSSPFSVTAEWSSDAPSVTIAGIPAKINSPPAFTATFTFNESVAGFESEDITLIGAEKGAFEGSGQIYTQVVNPSGSADIEITVEANSATDGSISGPTSAVTASVVWDATPPTLSIGGLPDRINSTATLSTTFTFSEQVTGFEASSVTVSGGSMENLTGSGARYALEITPSGNSDVVVSVAANVATDGVNTGPTTQQSFTTEWDSSPPILTITGVPETIISTGSFTTTFTFSEDVTGFDIDDIEITGAASGNLQGTGSAYMLEITPTGGQNVVITISENSLSDGLNLGPTSAVSATATWGGSSPSIFIEDATAIEGKPMTFTVTLDQVLTGGLTVTPIFTDRTATKGVDYIENTSPINFNGSAYESHTFVVETIVDELVEKDETFTVGLLISGTEQDFITSNTGTGTISDLGTPPSTSVLFVHGIHDTGVDIYLNDSRLLNDVSYRTAHLVDSVRVGMIKLDVVDSVSTSNTNPLYSDQIELKQDSTYQIFLIGIDSNEISSLVLPHVEGQIPADQVMIRTIHGAGNLGQVNIDLQDNYRLMPKLVDNLMYLNVSPLLTIPPKQYTISLTDNSDNSIIETFSMDWSQSSNRLGSLLVSGEGQSVSEGIEMFVVWDNGDIDIPMLTTSIDDQPLNVSFDEIVNYPNPFVERTNLSLMLNETGDINVEVVDILGRRVFSDILRDVQGGQTNVLVLESTNWAPGIYFYRITEARGESSKVHIGKMVRIR